MSYRPTQREFTDIETDKKFRLYKHDVTGDYRLISDQQTKDPEINGFYIAAHGPMTLKLNTKKVVKLDRGTFYNLKMNDAGVIETVTHKKYPTFGGFTKI